MSGDTPNNCQTDYEENIRIFPLKCQKQSDARADISNYLKVRLVVDAIFTMFSYYLIEEFC
jgi:hypothetical protein